MLCFIVQYNILMLCLQLTLLKNLEFSLACLFLSALDRSTFSQHKHSYSELYNASNNVISHAAATYISWKDTVIQKSHRCTNFANGSKDVDSSVYNINGSSHTLLFDRELSSEGYWDEVKY